MKKKPPKLHKKLFEFFQKYEQDTKWLQEKINRYDKILDSNENADSWIEKRLIEMEGDIKNVKSKIGLAYGLIYIILGAIVSSALGFYFLQ